MYNELSQVYCIKQEERIQKYTKGYECQKLFSVFGHSECNKDSQTWFTIVF